MKQTITEEPLESVNQICAALHTVFMESSTRLSRSSGFCIRRSPLSAQAYVRGLVFGWLANPQASVSALARSIASCGVAISPQAVQQRFSAAGAKLLRGILEEMSLHLAAEGLASTDLSMGFGFSRIWVRDGSVISLPKALAQRWPGCGNNTGVAASMKLSVVWDWLSGEAPRLHVHSGREHDASVGLGKHPQEPPAVAGEMHLFDLGYFCLQAMSDLHQNGAFFCCRYKSGTSVRRLEDGTEDTFSSSLAQRLSKLSSQVMEFDWHVEIGQRHPLPVRLIGRRVPPQIAVQRREDLIYRSRRKGQPVSRERLALCCWNLFVTNAPVERLPPKAVPQLYSARWQIERLFRLWKETLRIDQWRTQSPQRIECEIYAKLIGALLVQRLSAWAAWTDPARSIVKLTQALQTWALSLGASLHQRKQLKSVLINFKKTTKTGCKLQRRRHKPATFQILIQAQEGLD